MKYFVIGGAVFHFMVVSEQVRLHNNLRKSLDCGVFFFLLIRNIVVLVACRMRVISSRFSFPLKIKISSMPYRTGVHGEYPQSQS